MLFDPDVMSPSVPPPQALLDMRWVWNVLIILLSVTLLIRMLVLDVGGCLLTALTLCMAVMMVRDGMREMAHYALVYSVLCGLLFFFDIVVLLTEVGGRVSKHTDPVRALGVDGVRQLTYRLTVTTTPFIDFSQGFQYNLQSFSKIISPISLALATYISAKAHFETQRQSSYDVTNGIGRTGEDAPLVERPIGFGSGQGAGRTFTSTSPFQRFEGTAHHLGTPPHHQTLT